MAPPPPVMTLITLVTVDCATCVSAVPLPRRELQ
jgi:hypothetical protein